MIRRATAAVMMGVVLATGLLATDPLPRDTRFETAAKHSAELGGIATVVMLDGKIVFEDYPNGGAPARATELASGTKSFSGVLALCAVEDRLLSLDEKASDTLSEWRDDPARREITLRQLLTLTSGIAGGPTALETGRVPSYAEAIKHRAEAPRGEKFSYGPVPFQIFGEVLRRKLATKNQTVTGYLETKILKPLGIRPERWRKDAQGQPHLPSGAALTARDWARFGEAIRLDGRGLLPPGKITECFRGTTANPGYGLTWWLPAEGALGGRATRKVAPRALPRDTWQASGAGGQRLVIIPSLGLVAVRLAPVRGREGAFDDRGWLQALIAPLTQSAPAQP